MSAADPEVFDRLEHERVYARGRADDAAVAAEAATVGEVEVASEDVGDRSSGFGGDERACGVVPDFFYVVFACGKAEVGIGLSSGDDGILGLAVEAGGFAGAADMLEDAVGVADVGMFFFNGSADADGLIGVVVEASDADWGFAGVVEGALEGALASDAGVEAAVGVGEVEGCSEVAREVGAPECADGGLAAFDEAEADGVLLASEEALGAIDGVECPEAGRGGVALAFVDGAQDVALGGIGPCAADGLDGGCEVGGVGRVAEEAGIFFADEFEVAEALGKDAGDDGLRGEVGDGDGAFVVFGDGADLLERLLDLSADASGEGDGFRGGGEEAGIVVHGVILGESRRMCATGCDVCGDRESASGVHRSAARARAAIARHAKEGRSAGVVRTSRALGGMIVCKALVRASSRWRGRSMDDCRPYTVRAHARTPAPARAKTRRRPCTAVLARHSA